MKYLSLLLSLLTASHTLVADTRSAATRLSEKTPNLTPQYFQTHYGRPGIWVSALKPRFSGVNALVTLCTKDKHYALLTLQDRIWEDKVLRVAEGPGGGFDSTHEEGIERFSAREQILYKDFLAGVTTNHRELDARIEQRLRSEQSHIHPLYRGGDHNTYRFAVRETLEETGVTAVTLSDDILKLQDITRTIRLMRLDEDERAIMPMYHIAFSCADCKLGEAPFVARPDSNEEIVTAFWADFDAFQKVGGIYEVIHKGERFTVKQRNGWNEALDELFGVAPPALDLRHDALMSQSSR